MFSGYPNNFFTQAHFLGVAVNFLLTRTKFWRAAQFLGRARKFSAHVNNFLGDALNFCRRTKFSGQAHNFFAGVKCFLGVPQNFLTLAQHLGGAQNILDARTNSGKAHKIFSPRAQFFRKPADVFGRSEKFAGHAQNFWEARPIFWERQKCFWSFPQFFGGAHYCSQLLNLQSVHKIGLGDHLRKEGTKITSGVMENVFRSEAERLFCTDTNSTLLNRVLNFN
jgi:hypothetical protein